ncbi:hypothetical protein VNO77_22090 [Canavalia gladiata]|uniref:Uncharacterized protein n=1 Tax=Canavalia gladiata TaxID=3824 RepID=A0AAN9QA77_CANGL
MYYCILRAKGRKSGHEMDLQETKLGNSGTCVCINHGCLPEATEAFYSSGQLKLNLHHLSSLDDYINFTVLLIDVRDFVFHTVLTEITV